MTPADIDRVFGRGRLRMVTGEHVEVFREASQPGERRRYTKRFLATSVGDFREWTEREWRILARLVGHGIKPVPDVVQFDRGAADRPALVQTYDAGVTVDHWATLLPLQRDGKLLRNVFEDCAHWWALAQHSLIALDAIHELRLVHLDLKADNICIPVGPADFDPLVREQSLHPRFEDITLIDFAFSLVSGERLQNALPIARQPDFEYQSPRLLLALEAGRRGDLAPTRQLDWRCDLFSLAAMLWRYLPEFDESTGRAWTRPRHSKARALVRRLIEAHDSDLPQTRPHAELIALASAPLDNPELRQSLERGWALAIETPAPAAARPTPVTRIAQPLPTPVAAPIEPVFAASAAFAPGPTAGTLPAQTPRAEASAQASLAKTPPVQTPPAQTPAQTSLAEPTAVQPMVAQPAVMPPTVMQPTVMQPAVTQPAVTQPEVTQPTAVQPAVTQPLVAQPAIAQAPVAQPPLAEGPLAQTPSVQPPAVPPPAQAAFAQPALAEAAAMAAPAPAPISDQPRRRDRAPFETRPLPHPRADDTGLDHAGFDHAPISVDESDVEIRALARQQRERQRARRLAWTAGVAATAVAGVVLWAPWSDSTRMPSLPGLQGARLEARKGASSAAGRSVAAAKPARPVRADPSAASRTVPRPGADPAAMSPRVAVVVPNPPASAAASSESSPAIVVARSAPPPSVAVASSVSPPPIVSAAPSVLAPRGGVPGSAQGNAEVPVRPSAFPSRDAVLAQAQNQARAQMEMQRRGNPAIASPGAGPGQTATPRPSQAAGTDAAYPWAVAGKAPPSVVAVAPPTLPTAAPPRSGTTAPASAVSAGTSVVPPPPRSVLPAPGSSAGTPIPTPASAPSVSPAPGPEAAAEQPDFNARANDLMVNHVPRLAQRAERVVSRVLFAASRAEDVVGDGEVLESAAAIGRPAADAVAAMPVSARDAQQFNEAARAEYSRRGATPQALMLQVRAFGANPQDPDVVGNLAFLLLRQQPAQADAARRLALYALTLHGSRYPQGRVEDWATLAIASALSGRERDAKNALLVSLAVAPNLDRQCRAAMDTYTIYGERMRAPVEAMLYSAHSSRRAPQASACEWPPRWTMTSGR